MKVNNKVLLEYEKLHAEYTEMAAEATDEIDIEAYQELANDFLDDIARQKVKVIAKQSLVDDAEVALSGIEKKYEVECQS